MRFSRLLWFGLIILIFQNAHSAPAKPLQGYYTEEQVRLQTEGEPDDVFMRKSWYCGQMMAKDEQWQGFTIARIDQNQIHILDPQMKVYFTLTPDVLRRNVAGQLQLFGAQKKADGSYYFPEDLFVRTGATKVIGRWECYQVMTNPKYRSPEAPYVLFWYSIQVDFPVQVFGEQLKNFFGDSPEVQGLFDRLSKFEGYPVRTEAHGSSNTVVTTLLKLEHRRNMDPQIFEVPKEYTRIPLPENLPSPQWGK